MGAIAKSKEVGPMIISSVVLTACALFSLGVLKALFVGRHHFRSGFDMMFFGAITAGIGYLVGWLL